MARIRSLRAPRGLGRELRLIVAAAAAQDFLTALVVLAYGNTFLLRTLHAPPSYPAFALGVYGAARVAASPVVGRLADRAPAAAGLLAGGLQVLGMALILATGEARAYFVACAVISAGTTLAWLLILRAVGEASEPAERASATAAIGLVSLGATLSGLGAAALLEGAGWRIPFVAGAALAALTAGVLVTAGRHRHRGPAERERTLEAPGAASPGRRQAVAAAVVFLHFAAMTALVVATGPFVLQLLDLTLLRAGFVLLPAAATGIATLVLVGRRSRHGRRFREAAVLYAVAAVALVAIAPTSSVRFFAMGMVPLATLAGAQPLLNAGMVDASRLAGQPGRTLGWLSSAQGLGTVAGPALTGLAIEVAGIRAGMLAVAAMLAALALIATWAGRAIRV